MSGRIFVKAFKITIAVEVLTTIYFFFSSYFLIISISAAPSDKKFCSLGSRQVPFRPLGKDSKIKKRRGAGVCVDTATPLQTSNESTFALRF